MTGVEPEPIRTPRLELLPLRREYAQEMASVLSDPALHTYIGGALGTPQALHARYERLKVGSPDPEVTWLNWVIRLRTTNCLTGTVQATLTQGAPDSGSVTAELAWIVGTPWQRQGIATEAARALADWLTNTAATPVPVRTLIAHIHPAHTASEGVARAVGLLPTDNWRYGERCWYLRRPSG